MDEQARHFDETPTALHPAISREDRGAWLQVRTLKGFAWNRVTLPVPGLHSSLEGLRLVHLSDFHLRRQWMKTYDSLIERLAADPPDLLLFTGDFVEKKLDHRPALATLLRLVPALRARLGIYAIYGNHDFDLAKVSLPDLGITIIDGQRVRLNATGSDDSAGIELIGLPGIDRKLFDPAFVDSIPPRRPGDLRLTLSHFPDLWRHTAQLQPDLFLTGHTHGGQLCLPGGWPIITHDALPRRLSKGVHRLQNTWFIASRGFGFGKFRLRLFCPAEVIDIRLRSVDPR